VSDERSERDAAATRPESAAEEAPRRNPELTAAPPVAQVREEDLEPHAGLRYIARLFKGLAILIAFMLVAEVIIGLQQDGTAAIGLLLVQATRLVVFAGFLWGAGDIALMLIESNHDLRATRILLGRINNKLETAIGPGTSIGEGSGAPAVSGETGTGNDGKSPPSADARTRTERRGAGR
jgi:hypothetical protein